MNWIKLEHRVDGYWYAIATRGSDDSDPCWESWQYGAPDEASALIAAETRFGSCLVWRKQ